MAQVKLINAQHEGYSVTCTILEVHQYYHGYVVRFNAKTLKLTVTYTIQFPAIL